MSFYIATKVRGVFLNVLSILWHTFVSSRTILTWMRLHTSWWRISWLMTKVCHMRKAMATVSNWTRRLWLLRASQAAANARSIHVNQPPVRLKSGPPGFGPWAYTAAFQRKRNYLAGGGVFKAQWSCHPLANGHLFRTFEFLNVAGPKQKPNFISALAQTFCLHQAP